MRNPLVLQSEVYKCSLKIAKEFMRGYYPSGGIKEIKKAKQRREWRAYYSDDTSTKVATWSRPNRFELFGKHTRTRSILGLVSWINEELAPEKKALEEQEERDRVEFKKRLRAIK